MSKFLHVVRAGCACLVLAGCAGLSLGGPGAKGGVEVATGGPRPVPRPSSLAPAPPEGAVTAEAFDTTSQAEREAASALPALASEHLVGTTVATLGNPAEPGFWLETPLVSARGPGRVVAVANGASAQVTLIPAGGAADSGSRISLAALRLLGIGLTGLHELEVYTQ